jgi:uncharacterized membrane protein YpjA
VGWREAFHHFKRTPGWAVLIALINLVGIAYGFYYYREQFGITPWWWWPLVPDSPLAVLWAELALLAYWLKRQSAVLDALAFVGNVQVGLWTCYVLLAYAPSFGTLDFLAGGPVRLNTVLLVGHLGMAVLALIFVQGLRARRARSPRSALVGIGVAAAYYLVNDVIDYFGPDYVGRGCGLRPYTVPCDPAMEPLLAAVTLGLTLAAAAALLLATRPPRAARAPG